KTKPIGQGLKPARLTQRETAMLAGMNNHTLTKVSDCNRWLSPLEPAVDVAVRSGNVGVVGQFLSDALPIAPGRNLAIAVNDVVRVPRGDVVGNHPGLGPMPRVAQKPVVLKLSS